MQIIPINSITEDIPEEFFNLRNTSKQTEAKNKFIAEGPEVVFRHLMSGHVVEALLIDEKQFSKIEKCIEEKYERKPFKVLLCTKALISEIVGFKIHQGILSLGSKPDRKPFSNIEFPAIAFNGLVNAENVGGIIRTAQAFGIKTFIVDRETCDPWIRRCVRVSMGTIFSSEIFYCESLLDFITEIRAESENVKVVALEQGKKTLSVYDKKNSLDFEIMVLGSEKNGVSREILDSCSDLYEIPIVKEALNSLNVNCALSAFLAVRESR